ncbi:monovalent cation/H+ antiporter subunit D [Cereibacter azotoformans]|uniref:Multisubunit potassium/proton antiporter PhaD subunit n=2 Tax=Cereibacter TaxID=1653176 RepID=A0A2T5KEG8_9RHOB|nr:monovalent cation/H+ antiporter subunit D [Cereibacter azotoformans]AXQ92505.1 monovalent cation/H+ antiporter subunit D [Cereibacter sphaeroides]MBO4169918.1 monovalent cation/H+ antiporter subunit D [Cereibacter azotoformans]PTR20820.1 multisubunit potassium/proton antiporter PhaD subunit [Cereibacter azotoformans]UIJ30781.1 monovalent cation/H+ antiporter subunit D [Cereibacter azotoformans]ULB08541.1 monovalent cation/H+ antiporter subunit D [Cereibacter azotoformans]
MNHWIIAPVVLPAVLAPLIVLFMRHDLVLQRVFSLAGTIALCGVSGVLLVSASTNPPEAYFLGNWPAPFGIVLVLDRLAAVMVALTAFLALMVQLYAIGTGWDRRGQHFHALYQFQLMGICGAFLTGDAFNLFVFFEVLLIASYGLMIHGGGRARLRSGVQYVAYNLMGSTLFLFALATIYSVAGTLNLADLAERVAAMPEAETAILRVAGVLLLIVFAIKGALVPFQFWLPGTYAAAPGPVAALFAVMTKVGAYAVIRVFNLIFPPETPATGGFFAELLLPAALVTLAIGAMGVLGAASIGRLVAFGAIASMGTLFTAVAGFTPASTSAALFYLLHSTLATAALFLVADLVLARRGSEDLTQRQPPVAQEGLIAALFFVGAIALAGMPPLSGFLGKLLILDALRGPGMALIWGTVLVTSLLMIVGFARAGSLLFWKSHETLAEPEPHRPDTLAFVAVGGLVAGLVALTVAAGPVSAALGSIADELAERTPYIASNRLTEPAR